ncbi:sulfatase-like hydrolase/transferase [Aporhodopirellula aestuarii]|uniref:Sulfatase-like hydrolase/transferase n=1 Tax=Aporhodopirellula aestuarii TaxID=2950107 RepID=A0ABT0TZ02_9BACT|nr:sulfatase-like hydrolase/transferase [Aporhodopirellula aestuarii]MCM2369829.1 sulfatase-like hydrolase/transferase [Aporhodopirellula aestuarii]
MKLLLTFLFLATTACSVCSADDRPNIIVIMADDMGYADAGFTGATDIQTPNLDALAASGVTFTSGYVTHPYCGPSRAGLMSGRYQQRFGFETNPAYDPSNPYLGIDVNETLFPARLQKAGYRTGVIGKWHLGASAPFHPNNRGFDYFYGFLGGGHDYFKIDLRQPVKEGYTEALERNGKPAVFDGYLTTALSNDAAEFVNSSSGEPFFLYLAFNAPHAPLQAPQEAIAKYSHIKNEKRKRYAAMVDVMDAGIGTVISALEQNNLRDNTLVFFLSDNGGPQSTKSKPTSWNGSSNDPFRGGKGNLYDGGVHVPFIASWPARIEKGTVYPHPVISLDIAATACAIASGDSKLPAELEGTNLLPLLNDQTNVNRERYLYWREGGVRWSILDSKRVKHLQDSTDRPAELYRLPEDVAEQNDRIEAEPEVAEQLRKEWLSWNESNVASRLGNYKGYHALRDQFFLDSIPKGAKEEGYSPVPIPTFK